jgi:hypothetical protein
MPGTDAITERLGTCKRCQCRVSGLHHRGPLPSLCVDCRSVCGSRAVCRVVCIQCGTTTFKQQPAKFCCQSCHHQWQHDHADKHPCKQCGSEFACKKSDVQNGRSYCSDACRRKAWRQDRTGSCGHCGIVFSLRSQHKDKNIFCSRACAFQAKKSRNAKQKAILFVHALVRRLQRSYRQRQTVLQRAAQRAAAQERKRNCIRCGKLFRNGKDKLCSLACRAESRRINKRAGKSRAKTSSTHAARCKAKGLPHDPAITKEFVVSRDRGVCLLCGVATASGDRRLAPTIGHIVPLNNPLNKLHGHTANNTYTNCAGCNGRQGNAVMIDGHQNHHDPRESYLEHVRRSGYPILTNCHFVQDPMPASHDGL